MVCRLLTILIAFKMLKTILASNKKQRLIPLTYFYESTFKSN